jgi:hypothetical protein
MNQNSLDRAVARATGEDTGRIRRMGFRLVGVGASAGLDRLDRLRARRRHTRKAMAARAA